MLVRTIIQCRPLALMVTLAALLVCATTQAAMVRVYPDTARASYIYDSVFLEIRISEVDSLYGLAVDVGFDPSIVELMSVVEGEFLRGTGVDSVATSLTTSYTPGNLVLGLSQIALNSPGRACASDTSLLTLKFRILSLGQSAITLTNIGLIRPDGASMISSSVQDGVILINYPSLHTVLGFNPPDTVVGLADRVRMALVIDSVDRIHAFSCDIAYDPENLLFDSVTEGTVLSDGGSRQTAFDYIVSSDDGRVTIGGSILAALDTGVTVRAAAPLAQLYFTPVQFGSTSLRVSDPALFASNGTSQYPIGKIDSAVVTVQPAVQTTSVGFNPIDTTVYRTQKFRLALTVDDVDRLFGYSVDLTYLPNTLRVDSIIEGPIWNSFGYQSFFDYAVDSSSGHMLIGSAILSSQGLSVSTMSPLPLAYIFLTALEPDSVSVDIDSVGLLAPNGFTQYPVAFRQSASIKILPTTEIVIQPGVGDGNDAYVSQALPTSNFGSDTALLVRSGASLISSLVKFPTPSLGSDALISSAEVGFYGGKTSTRDTVSLHAAATPWVEQTITWNTRPDTGQRIATDYSSEPSWWKWDVTQTVRNWIDSTEPNNGFVARTQSNFGDQLSFYSSEDTLTPDRSPKLVVNYYYPPTCADLVIAGNTLQYSKTPIVDGDSIQISVDIYNTGATPVDAITVRFYEGVPGIGQYTLIGQTFLSYISDYGHSTASTWWNTGGRQGSRTVFVWVNPDHTVEECDTLNNRASFFTTVLPKPNLTISCDRISTIPGTPVEGDSLTIRAIVSNDGSSPAPSSLVKLDVTRSDVEPFTVGSGYTRDQLPGGLSDTFTFVWLTAGFRGSFNLSVVIDSIDAARESNELDNEIACPITVFNPSLVLTTDCPAASSPNDSVIVTVRLNNTGGPTAHDVVTSILLPAELSFVSSSPLPDSTGLLTWTVDSIAEGSQLNLIITCLMRVSAVPGSVIDIATRTEYMNRSNLPQAALLAINTVSVGSDVTPPQMVISMQPQLVRVDSVRISCTASEPLLGPPALVALSSGGDTLSTSGPTAVGGSYIFSVWVGPDVPSGQASVRLTAVDSAGNSGSRQSYFTVDHDKPGMSSTLRDTVSLGSHTFILTSTEYLPANPVLDLKDSANSTIPVMLTSKSGNQYAYRFEVTTGTGRGWSRLTVQMTDAVGNSAAYTDSFFVLNDRPRIAIAMPARLPLGSSQVIVSIDKRVQGFPEIHTYDAASFQIKLNGPNAAESVFTYLIRIDSSTVEGTAQLYVKVTDLYGNQADSTHYFLVDRTPPSFVMTSPDPPTGSFTLEIEASEPLASAPVVSFFNRRGRVGGAVSLDSAVASIRYFYSALEQSGVTSIRVEGVDLAGNAGLLERSFVDVAIASADISFSAVPATGEPVTIGAVVHNLGESDADSVLVSFWRDYPQYGTAIGTVIIEGIAAGDSAEVQLSWPANQQPSSYVVYAVVDENCRFIESREDNNMAWRGSMGIAAITSKPSYVLGVDTALAAFSQIFSLSNGVILNSSEVSLTAELKDTLGNVVLSSVPTTYDSVAAGFDLLISLSQLQMGKYRLHLSADAGGGMGIVRDSLTFGVSQQVAVSLTISPSQYYRRDTVEIAGITKYADSSTASGLTVSLLISSNGGNRGYNVKTLQNGSFQVEFVPHALEAGSYSAIAQVSIGGIVFADTAGFEIQGMMLQPSDFSITISQNSAMSATLTGTNIGTQSLFIDSVVVQGPSAAQTGLHLTPVLGGPDSTISLGETAAISVGIQASPYAVSTAEFSIIVFFNDTLSEECKFHIATRPAAPSITVFPSFAEFYMSPGKSFTRQIKFRNTGFTAWRDLRLAPGLPNWLSAHFPAMTDSLKSDQEQILDISVTLSDTMPLGIYDASLVINSSNYQAVTLPIRVYITASTTGNQSFYVQTPVGLVISGTTIQLYSQVYDPIMRTYPVYTGGTDDTGWCLFSNLPANSYQYRVEAQNYQARTGFIAVGAGESGTAPDTIVLEPLAVEVEWVVHDTTITDTNNVTLNVVYNTSVPWVVMIPHIVSHSGYRGDEFFGSFTLMNIGLRAADQVVLSWPDNSYFTAQPNGGLPAALLDGLAPNESVEIHYKLSVKQAMATCSSPTGWLQISSSYNDRGFAGTTDNWGQFVVDGPCDNLRIEPPGLVRIDAPCYWNGTCECDYSGFMSQWSLASKDSLMAFNDGAGIIKLGGVYSFEVPLPGYGIGVGNIPLVGQFLSPSQAPKVGYWGPTEIGPGDSSKAYIAGLRMPHLGVSFAVGIALVLYENAWGENKYRGIPVAKVSISDLGLGCLFSTGYRNPSCSGCSTSDGNIPPGTPSSGLQPLPGPPMVEEYKGGLVKLRIDQRTMQERQAFTADLELTNGYSDWSITDLDVDIMVTDTNELVIAENQYADGPLFFASPQLTNIGDVDGGGELVAQASGSVHWLIIPKTDAGGTDSTGQRYRLSARISYRINGLTYSYLTATEEITVLPQPKLRLVYLYPRVIEDMQPFSLAVVAKNVGYGTARNLRIDSDQPIVLEGAQFLTNFEIISATVRGESRPQSLLMDFGDILPGHAAVAHWSIVASPRGSIDEFNVQFTHSTALGGTSTSLIENSQGGRIVRDSLRISSQQEKVAAAFTGFSGFHGILANTDGDDLPDVVYDAYTAASYGVAIVLPDSVHLPTFLDPMMTLYMPAQASWVYTRSIDPFAGTKIISSVARQDGSVVPQSNCWVDSGYIHIADLSPGNVRYVITYANLSYKPDLNPIADSMTFLPCAGCGTVTAGDSTLDIRVPVANLGNLLIGPVQVYLYDGEPGSGMLIDSFHTDSIAVGQQATHQVTWKISAPGNWQMFYHRIYAVVDPHNQYNELDESNNTASAGVDINLVTGDVNHDKVIDIRDILYQVEWVFRSGPEAIPSIASDLNCDALVDIRDIVQLVWYTFRNGPEPCNHRQPGQKPAMTDEEGTVHIAVSGKPGGALSLTVIGQANVPFAGMEQQYFVKSKGLQIDSVTCTALPGGFKVYWSVADSLLKLGIVDLSGKSQIPAGSNHVATIYAHTTPGTKIDQELISHRWTVASDSTGRALNIETSLLWDNQALLPSSYSLSQNYPNPFNPTTSIEFALPKAGATKLTIFNILGQVVTRLVNQNLPAGYHKVVWDGTNSENRHVATGLYFYRLETGSYVASKKMLLLK